MSKSEINPILAIYLGQLAKHPLRTKSATAGVLCALQEITSCHLAGVPFPRPSKEDSLIKHALARAKIDIKTLKMFIYGSLVSAPLGHILSGKLQAKMLEGMDARTAAIARLLSSNLLIAPINTTVFLASMAIIEGARSVDAVLKTVKAGFFPVIQMTWILSPIITVIMGKFIPPMYWAPFLNLVSFSIGTIFGTRAKKMKLADARKAKKLEDDKKRKEKAKDGSS